MRFTPTLILAFGLLSSALSGTSIEAAPRAPRTASHTHKAPAPKFSRDQLYMELIGGEDDWYGQLVRVRRMLDSGISVNVRFDDADHDTPLTHAAGFGSAAVVSLLLARGAQPNATDDRGHTALWNAAHVPLGESGSMTKDGPVPPTKAQRQAWTHAYVSIIRSLLKHGANPNIADVNGVTPLGIAAYRGRDAEVLALLRGHANPNLPDRFGKTPLDWASYNGHTSVVRLLQKYGARSRSGHWLPLPAQRTQDMALIAAIEKHDVSAVKEALAHKADPNAVVSSSEDHWYFLNLETPLSAAVDSPLLTALLLRAGSNTNRINDKGETPIMRASLPVAKLLFARGANINARDNDGTSALMKAAAGPDANVALVQFLLAHGANVRARDSEGSTALMKCNSEKILKMLLAHGANINATNNQGQSALMETAQQGYGEGGVTCDAPWGRLLLRYGANPNLRDHEGRTALMILSAPFGQATNDEEYYDNDARLSLARALLSRGARTDIRDSRGQTALQIAHHSGAKQLARLLKKRH